MKLRNLAEILLWKLKKALSKKELTIFYQNATRSLQELMPESSYKNFHETTLPVLLIFSKSSKLSFFRGMKFVSYTIFRSWTCKFFIRFRQWSYKNSWEKALSFWKIRIWAFFMKLLPYHARFRAHDRKLENKTARLIYCVDALLLNVSLDLACMWVRARTIKKIMWERNRAICINFAFIYVRASAFLRIWTRVTRDEWGTEESEVIRKRV